MYVSLLVRTVRPGRTYEDFLRAWYPDKGFAMPGRGPITARNLANEREIATLGFVDAPDRAALEAGLERVAAQEAVRHDRIDEVIESASLRGIYEVLDEFDFSTDATVAAGRPSL